MHVSKLIWHRKPKRRRKMTVNQLIAQLEMMRVEELRRSLAYDDEWLNAFHTGRESALAHVLKILKEAQNEC